MKNTKRVCKNLTLIGAIHMVRLQLQFVITTNGLYGIQCKCSHSAIETTEINPIQPISCQKLIVVTIASCEHPLTTHEMLTYRKDLTKGSGIFCVTILINVSYSIFVFRYCAHFEVTHTKGRCNMRNQYQGWTQMLTKGQTICVECQPLAMKRKLGVRCSGDGIYLKVTSFTPGKL